MSDYFRHWLNVGARLKAEGAKLPRIYCVNWFRKGPDGKFVWPGYGENMRVLEWIVGRVEGEADGREHVFGVTPTYDDLNWEGLEFSMEQFHLVTSIERDAWHEELRLHAQLFEQLASRLPEELAATKAALEARLAAH